MAENLPYSSSVGTLEKMLVKIKNAPAPEKVTGDFINTKLAMKGGTARGCIPFLKKMGFVADDATPTDLYHEFRNPAKSKYAIAAAFKKLYQRLYEMNEYVHEASEGVALGLIVECTGNQADSSVTKYTLSTFNMLKKYAEFQKISKTVVKEKDTQEEPIQQTTTNPFPLDSYNQKLNGNNGSEKSINLSYTINLNLPPTKDIEVFNAIFKSLKQHLLGD